MPKIVPSDLKSMCFDRFQSIYGYKGAWPYKDDPEKFGVEWMRVLRHCYPHELKRAVDLWVASDEKEWPTPGELLKRIKDSEPRVDRVFTDPRNEDDCGCGIQGCRWGWYAVVRKDGTTTPRRIQGCRAQREGLGPA